jgi:hypoxanthine-DNA glycosylase
MRVSAPQPSRSFPPVVNARVRLLLLGSLPGVQSLRAERYYANPRNQFWVLVGGVIGQDLVPLDYPERLETLLAHGIGLWDTVAEAHRPGSLDSAMREVTANPLAELVDTLPRLEAVGFNGGTAARIGRRMLDGRGLTLIDLPSSSPALTIPLAAKAERWKSLSQHVDSAGRVRPAFPA